MGRKKYKIFSVYFFLALCIVRLAFADSGEKTAPAEPKPPFTGRIKGDNVNIRSGASPNFEILAKANSNDNVLVEELVSGWYKIKLPLSAACYVSKDYIEKKDDAGISKISNLNLRARPDKESSVLGQLKKGQTVAIADENLDGFYRIVPPDGCYGWVHAGLAEYVSSGPKALTQTETAKKPAAAKTNSTKTKRR